MEKNLAASEIKFRSVKKVLLPLVVLLMMGAFPACRKHPACWDEALYNEHKNDVCTADCPGVRGCDGKTYCNECVANREGIRVE